MGTERLFEILSYDATWIACRKYIARNISRHDAPSSNDGARTNGDARQNDGAASHPDVRADDDRLAVFLPSPGRGIQWMKWRVDLHRRSKESEIPDRDGADVEHDAIEVEEDALAEVNVLAVVAVEGRLHPDGVAAGAKKPAEDGAALVAIALASGIQMRGR